MNAFPPFFSTLPATTNPPPNFQVFAQIFDCPRISLPGGYRVTWTGMRVLKHDGSQHHGVGIIPHVRVERTIKGVKAGRDEFLEKAIEIAKQ